MKVRAFHVIRLVAVSALLAACGGGVAASNGPRPAPEASATGAPVPAPRPGILGCVESRELKAYVLALEAHRQQARRAALAAFGARLEERRGAFGSAGASALGDSYDANGKRFAVAAELAPHFEPRTALAKRGPELRRIDERPRAHAVDVLVCGVERCAPPSSGARVPARPLVVELAPGESWGGTLALSYDYWWARVRYRERETCPARPEE